MAINVYWACLEDEWLRASKPVPLSKLFYDKKLYIKLNHLIFIFKNNKVKIWQNY